MSYTAPEAEADFREKMGDVLGSVFSYLWGEFIMLHRTWNEFLDLFGTKPSRVDLMNEAAPDFFDIVQQALFDRTLLHICRLCDSSRGKDGPRGSLNYFLELDHSFKAERASLIADLKSKTSFAKGRRDRVIAHTDLNLALTRSNKPLEPASRMAVKEAIAAIDAVMQKIEGRHLGTTTYYSGIRCVAGGLGLLLIIRDGLNADDQRRERLRSGMLTPQDLLPSEPI